MKTPREDRVQAIEAAAAPDSALYGLVSERRAELQSPNGETAMFSTRYITEQVLRSICSDAGERVRRPQLAELADRCQQGDFLPVPVLVDVRTIQNIVNPGAHPQREALRESHLLAAMDALARLLRWRTGQHEGSAPQPLPLAATVRGRWQGWIPQGILAIAGIALIGALALAVSEKDGPPDGRESCQPFQETNDTGERGLNVMFTRASNALAGQPLPRKYHGLDGEIRLLLERGLHERGLADVIHIQGCNASPDFHDEGGVVRRLGNRKRADLVMALRVRALERAAVVDARLYITGPQMLRRGRRGTVRWIDVHHRASVRVEPDHIRLPAPDDDGVACQLLALMLLRRLPPDAAAVTTTGEHGDAILADLRRFVTPGRGLPASCVPSVAQVIAHTAASLHDDGETLRRVGSVLGLSRGGSQVRFCSTVDDTVCAVHERPAGDRMAAFNLAGQAAYVSLPPDCLALESVEGEGVRVSSETEVAVLSSPVVIACGRSARPRCEDAPPIVGCALDRTPVVHYDGQSELVWYQDIGAKEKLACRCRGKVAGAELPTWDFDRLRTLAGPVQPVDLTLVLPEISVEAAR